MIARFFKLEPALVTTAAAAVYAAAAMLYRAFVAKDVAVLDWDLLMAAVAAVMPLWVRLRATPLERPRDAQGRPLVSTEAAAQALAPHVPATDRTPPL